MNAPDRMEGEAFVDLDLGASLHSGLLVSLLAVLMDVSPEQFGCSHVSRESPSSVPTMTAHTG